MTPSKVVYMGRNQRRLTSIHQCLVALGAAWSDVYIKPGEHKVIPRGRQTTSIWDRLGAEELSGMVERLYREGMRQHHPDQHGGDAVHEERCRELGQAYLRARKILANREKFGM